MKFNLKTILVGGVLFYIAQFVVSLVTGPLLHQGIMDPLYKATQEFWRPELAQDPPDMATLMPRWITVGLLMAFLFAGIFDNIRSAFNGSAVVQGVKFGVVMGLVFTAAMAGWSGVFNLPDQIWLWWAAESYAYFIVGGAALGWYVGKWGG